MLYLILNIGKDLYSVNCRDIVEIIPLVSFKTLPGAPDYIRGVFDYHGKIIPAVDISVFFGLSRAEDLYSTRIIIANDTDNSAKIQTIGLVAEKVTETVSGSDMERSPVVLNVGNSPALGEIVSDSGRIIQHLDIKKLFNKEIKKTLFHGGGNRP